MTKFVTANWRILQNVLTNRTFEVAFRLLDIFLLSISLSGITTKRLLSLSSEKESVDKLLGKSVLPVL